VKEKKESPPRRIHKLPFPLHISDVRTAYDKSKGDKGMAEWITEPESKQQVQISDLAYGLTEHTGEHYGQLVVYYRLAGLVPPESRPKK